MTVFEKIEAQQKGRENTAVWMVGEQLKDICRDGCWMCHNQGVNQLRQLRKNYSNLWALLLKWDKDSPVNFHPDGHTVHDFDERFRLEDEGFIQSDKRFFWRMLNEPLQKSLF